MEPFLDGGLFEVLIAVLIGYSLNFIFLKKYLLVIFSLVSIVAPVLLFFIHAKEIFYWLVSICIFNTVFLITLLWKQRITEPGKSLFDVKRYVDRYFKKSNLPVEPEQAVKWQSHIPAHLAVINNWTDCFIHWNHKFIFKQKFILCLRFQTIHLTNKTAGN